MTDLRNLVLQSDLRDCRKHGLSADCVEYAERVFNELSPSEQLFRISEALDELLADREIPEWLK